MIGRFIQLPPNHLLRTCQSLHMPSILDVAITTFTRNCASSLRLGSSMVGVRYGSNPEVRRDARNVGYLGYTGRKSCGSGHRSPNVAYWGKSGRQSELPELRFIAKSRSSGDAGKMLFTFRHATPDAGNPHVRFDERGGETERCRTAQATAPLLDSTGGNEVAEASGAYLPRSPT